VSAASDLYFAPAQTRAFSNQLILNSWDSSIRVIRVRQEVASQIALSATLSIRGNPTAECADGNARVLSPHDNVEKSESPIRINCQDKDAMKKQMLNHCKSRNTRQAKWLNAPASPKAYA